MTNEERWYAAGYRQALRDLRKRISKDGQTRYGGCYLHRLTDELIEKLEEVSKNESREG